MAIAPKKHFGQNFLINKGIVEKIAFQVKLLSRKQTLPVIEIGCGHGALTKVLLEHGHQLTGIEIDKDLYDGLEDKFSNFVSKEKFNLVKKDVLSIDLAKFDREMPGEYIVCGNLPYNIGTEIVFRFMEQAPRAVGFCFMLQREVVEKFVADPKSKKYGVPSVIFAWGFDVKDKFWVSPGSFKPAPAVESGVFSYVRKKEPLLSPFVDEAAYKQAKQLVHKSYNQRRKMLRVTLPQLIDHVWATKRPEELAPEDWLKLL